MDKETIKFIITSFLLIILISFGFSLFKNVKENHIIYNKVKNKLEAKAGPTKKLDGIYIFSIKNNS